MLHTSFAYNIRSPWLILISKLDTKIIDICYFYKLRSGFLLAFSVYSPHFAHNYVIKRNKSDFVICAVHFYASVHYRKGSRRVVVKQRSLYTKKVGKLNTQFSHSNKKACYYIPILQKRSFKERTKIL
jgi:hypothetical protein